MTSASFGQTLGRLERRALEIQIEHFKITPQERGRVFYAMEVVGEIGELVNDCKKLIRTKLAHRRAEQLQSRIPEEAADCLIALMLVKHAAQAPQAAQPALPAEPPADDLVWLHQHLSTAAVRAASLYAEEARRQAPGVPLDGSFNLELYATLVEELLTIARYFRFDLAEATNNKLTQIIAKVAAGHYD